MVVESQCGQITWPALFVTFLFSVLALATLLRAKQTSLELQRMTNHALCLKRGLKLTESYTSRMGKFNRGIQLQFYARMSALALGRPGVARVARITQKATQKAQLLYHFNHLKNLAQIKNCTLLKILQFTKLIPYRSTFGMITRRHRKFDGTTQLKNSWRRPLDFKLGNLSYLSEVRVNLEGRFSTFKYSGKRFTKLNVPNLTELRELQDLLKWKRWL